MEKSVDPVLHSVASDLGLHYLSKLSKYYGLYSKYMYILVTFLSQPISRNWPEQKMSIGILFPRDQIMYIFKF